MRVRERTAGRGPVSDIAIVSVPLRINLEEEQLNHNTSWDWTDHEFTKKLLSPAMMGGTGGHDGAGGALVDGPFSLGKGWVATEALHRPSWFVPMIEAQDEGEKNSDEVQTSQRPSLGRSIVRYVGDVNDLANRADILDIAKRKAMFGPDKLVVRADNVQPVPDDEEETEVPHTDKYPRGTFHIGDSLPVSVWTSLLGQQDRSFSSFGSFDACDEYPASRASGNIPLRIRE